MEMYCYWINPDRYEARRKQMEALLSTLEFSGVERVVFNEQEACKRDTMTKAHLKALNRIKEVGNYPALLLEDDVAMQSTLELPEIPECDLIYLGISVYNCGEKPDLRIEPYNENWVQIKYSLSAHALLFINENSVNLVIEAYERAIKNGTYNDIELALISDKHLFLAPKEGVPFYQNDYTEGVTRVKY